MFKNYFFLLIPPEHLFDLLLVFFTSFAFRLSDENMNGPVDAMSDAARDFFPTGFRCEASGWTLNDLQQRNNLSKK